MIYFGCLPFLLIIIGFILFASVVNMGLRLVERIGATAVWLYESFLNIFRTEKKEVVNPWTGGTNFDDGVPQDEEFEYRPTEQKPKRYESSDGEYIDFTDVK